MFFPLCGYRIIRSGLDLNVYRWTILSKKYEVPIILTVQAEHVNKLHCLLSTKAWILKTKPWKFQTHHILLFYLRFCLSFLILIWSTGGKILNISGHFTEAWCVPSAACGSWLYQSQNRVQSMGVFVGLLLSLYIISLLVFYLQLKPKNRYRFRNCIFARKIEVKLYGFSTACQDAI
jgi:hypothetical protein